MARTSLPTLVTAAATDPLVRYLDRRADAPANVTVAGGTAAATREACRSFLATNR